MTFDAIYETSDDADAGHRVITAATLADAKLELRRQMESEGVAYRLDMLVETAASFAARRAA